MRFSPSTPRDDHPILNLTPMIDVIFLLIIFFMTVARLTAVVSTAPVELPPAREANARVYTPGRVVVNVLSDGRLALGDEVVDFAELRARLSRVARGARPKVLIRADRRAPLGAVKRVVEACVAVGLRRLAFGAQPISAVPGRTGRRMEKEGGSRDDPPR